MSIHRLRIVLGMVSLLPWFSISEHPARAAEFTGLGDLPGGSFYSVPFAIPADSKAMVVVGASLSALGTQAFYWTPTSGMVGLGDLPDGEFHSAAVGVSVDGSVVVGSGSSSSGTEAFRWEGGQMTGLGDLPGGEFFSGAADVSADGSVIVGGGESAWGPEAFRREDGVMTGLGDLQGGPFDSIARGISNDVSVIVGRGVSAASSLYGAEAFRWEGGQMTGLGDLPGGAFWSDAWATSADGSVIVGRSVSASGSEAFRWEGGQMTGLGDLPGGDFASKAFSVSGDGSVIVGTGTSAESNSLFNEAFIWNSVNGMLGLQDVLEDHLGLDLAGWTLTSARDISFDSRVITGEGINPQGNREAWLVQSWGNPFGPIYVIVIGDFNKDDIINAVDIDLLRLAINANSPDPIYDVNGDGLDGTDFDYQVQAIINTAFGDANLDKRVNFKDFVSLSTHFGSSGTGWAQGNFNLDDITNFADFVALANNYGADLSSGVSVPPNVPEPTSLVLLSLAIGFVVRRSPSES